MSDAFLKRLAEMEASYDSAEASLASAEVYSNSERLQTIQRELAAQRRVMEAFRRYKRWTAQLAEAQAMAAGADGPELAEMGALEAAELGPRVDAALGEIRDILASDDDLGHPDVIVEIRAGTGGGEASLFAADLLRMYLRLAERRGWKVDLMSESRSEVGGIKEVILSISGEGAFKQLRFEGGVHRVQRVPATEAQGRIHTSTATVAVLPVAEEVDVQIRPEEVRIETKRASGAGGQHVNTTDSAVRMVHLPTGIVVECQDERSQHKNKAKADKLLRAKVFEHFQREADKERASTRKSLVGSGQRSEKIRTYNFPDSRVKDHRINFMVHDVTGMLGGSAALDEMLGALADFEKEQRLSEL